MDKLLSIIPGRKTYFVGLAMIVSGLVSYLLPDVAASFNIMVSDPGQLVMEGLGLIFLRKGVKGATT